MEVEKLLAGEIMSSPLIEATPDDTVQFVIELMALRRIRSVVIHEDGSKDAFIITSGDIIRYLANHPEGIKGLHTREFMNGPLVPVNIKDPISKAAEIMTNYGVKRVVVVNDLGEYVGIITIRDILGRNFKFFQPATPFLLLTFFKNSGVTIFQYQFPTVEDFFVLDPDLLGSSMTAIALMTDELLQESGGLKVVRKENFVLMLEEGEYLKALIVADRESIELRKVLVDFVKAVEDVNYEVFENMQAAFPPPLEVFVIQEVLEKLFTNYLQPPTLTPHPNRES